jgi:hypothetical protein
VFGLARVVWAQLKRIQVPWRLLLRCVRNQKREEDEGDLGPDKRRYPKLRRASQPQVLANRRARRAAKELAEVQSGVNKSALLLGAAMLAPWATVLCPTVRYFTRVQPVRTSDYTLELQQRPCRS